MIDVGEELENKEEVYCICRYMYLKYVNWKVYVFFVEFEEKIVEFFG